MSAPSRSDGKRRAKALVYLLLRYSGVAGVTRHTAQRRRVTILAYHDPEPDAFGRALKLLTRLYSVIPLETYLAARRAGDLSSLPLRPLVITLDDGWAGNALLAPALEAFGIRPTIFVSTAVVGTNRHFWWTHAGGGAQQESLKEFGDAERLARLAELGFSTDREYPERQALSLEELRRMSSIVDFEAHTRTHPILPACTDARAREEIEGSVTDLERMLGARPRVFAYPNGDFSPRDVDLVRRAGLEFACTIDPGYNGVSGDPLLLHRIFMEDDAGPSEIVACASGVYRILMRTIRGRRARAQRPEGSRPATPR